MSDLSKMEVWNLALDLAESIYNISNTGKMANDYSYKDQIRRAALSIPSNIAEGLASGFDKIGIRYFYIAKGSLAEVKTQLILAQRIKYINVNECHQVFENIEIVDKMLNKLISYRKKKNKIS